MTSHLLGVQNIDSTPENHRNHSTMTVLRSAIFSLLFCEVYVCVRSFAIPRVLHHSRAPTREVSSIGSILSLTSEGNGAENSKSLDRYRRSLLLGGLLFGTVYDPPLAYADEVGQDEESFASIAARANKISKEVNAAQPKTLSSMILPTDKTAYEFSLPVEGKMVTFGNIIRQQYDGGEEDSVRREARVKAILVVNIKQDDPVARKSIPELISLAAKYRGDLAVVACPTDQGYFEPDTSQLIRLKLASEYGYGINPSTSTTDKVNLLGTGAVPFWRWLQSTCRTPAGLGRVEGNFEKFLLDGNTGLPLRRYPRKYRPLNIANDIEAVIANKPLPPAGANYLEEWRSAAAEAERDTYRFEKGLNYFDQRV